MRLHRTLRAGIAALVLGAGLAVPAATLGTVRDGCTAMGTATSSGTIDLTTATEWHMMSTDVAGGTGTAPTPMKTAQVAAYGLGLPIPIASGQGDGDVAGSVTGVSVATYAVLGARFTVAGSASGDGGSCSGEVTIILDDVNPLFTVFGGGGLLLALLGLLVIVAAARSSGGCLMLALAVLFGGLGGAGLGLALEQFGLLDPTSFLGLGIAIIGALIGGGLSGRFGRTPPAAPATA